ncbi:hypothetical protein BpHYR1_028209 [Brachionus plicatilis]|uniref:Uncharacterized protein n=1 Tax=Brachionus plicatilis TaxID=10195 RepID=A0A3M7P979_BRAPC|nr:hypothetical protein BpHYR1_028209 [Brachionus plicatilis]
MPFFNCAFLLQYKLYVFCQKYFFEKNIYVPIDTYIYYLKKSRLEKINSKMYLWAQFSPLCANRIPPDYKKLIFDQKSRKKRDLNPMF